MIYLRYDIRFADDIRFAYEGTDISYSGSCISFGAAEHHIASAIYHLKGVNQVENKLVDLSFEFSVAIVQLIDNIQTPKSAYMIDQLARAGTSIGANIHEAQYAHGRKDFIAKMEIALKESSETSYWLKLLYKTGRISEETYRHLEKLCGNIRRLLIATCKTTKENT